MARFDLDGFRIDTVKYVDPKAIETFGNAMREFALTLGKQNFFTFGEIYDEEATIAAFIGRNAGPGEGFGIDAALDFPLFFRLPAVAKGFADVAGIRAVFEARKAQESALLSSHGEAGRFFVSFLDNHDQHARIRHPATPEAQVLLAATLLFTLQGIPCLYYGTEQGLSGTVDAAGAPDLASNESVREALWGKPGAFDTTTPAFRALQAIVALRRGEPALCFGRLYFREVSGNGQDFGHSSGRRRPRRLLPHPLGPRGAGGGEHRDAALRRRGGARPRHPRRAAAAAAGLQQSRPCRHGDAAAGSGCTLLPGRAGPRRRAGCHAGAERGAGLRPGVNPARAAAAKPTKRQGGVGRMRPTGREHLFPPQPCLLRQERLGLHELRPRRIGVLRERQQPLVVARGLLHSPAAAAAFAAPA